MNANTATPARRRLPPAERRRTILTAITPLLMEKGASLTTAEIAQAAGVSEATIFKVFPDKAAVIYEAVKASIDPTPTREALETIDSSLPLSSTLTAAGTILLERLDRALGLAEVLRSMPESAPTQPNDARQFVIESNRSVTQALTEVLDRHVDELAVSPGSAAAALRGLVFSCGSPFSPPAERLSLEDAIAILLRGIARTDGDI